jgi:hypothetical protein
VPIVLSLHGTGVAARSQADSFKFMPSPGAPGFTGKGKYRFGVENAWLCAPTRHGAHNWDTATGQQTAISAAEALSLLSRHHAFPVDHGQHAPLPFADAGRIVYGGHSMGGHGGWVLSTCEPDRAIGKPSALSPSSPASAGASYSAARTQEGKHRRANEDSANPPPPCPAHPRCAGRRWLGVEADLRIVQRSLQARCVRANTTS